MLTTVSLQTMVFLNIFLIKYQPLTFGFWVTSVYLIVTNAY